MTLSARQIPNVICLLRIALIPPIVWLLLQADYRNALILVVVAGVSDMLDGWLAKQFGWQTRIGGLLDPLADKLLLVSLFVTLAWLELTPLWLAAVVLGRDLVIVSGALAFNILIQDVQPDPSKISKLNTLLQLTYTVLVVAAEVFPLPLAILLLISGAAVLVTSVVSGLDYVLTWSQRAQAG